MHGATEADTST